MTNMAVDDSAACSRGEGERERASGHQDTADAMAAWWWRQQQPVAVVGGMVVIAEHVAATAGLASE